MSCTRLSLVVVSLAMAVGCGSSTPPRQATLGSVGNQASVAVQHAQERRVEEEEASSPAPVVEIRRVARLPTCERQDDCQPPVEFTQAVCKSKYPGLAIAMFEKSSPWQRLYLKVERAEAVNSYGARAPSGDLEYGEEVLLLRDGSTTDDSGIQVSGASDVDLMRWDGTCVTARRELFAPYMMPQSHNATISIRSLDDGIRAALLEQKYVSLTYKKHRVACRSSRASNPTAECAKATERLNDAITVAVRGGMEVPTPKKLPRWAPPSEELLSRERLSRAETPHVK